MYNCVELTDSNDISAPLSVRSPEISQIFCRCASHLILLKKLAKFDREILNVRPSLCLSPLNKKCLHRYLFYFLKSL